jgi:3-isopropylmalate/(R)-2-methylmalate dehydratase small subunit
MIKKRYEGKAWKFGNDVSTDTIAPGRFFHLRSNPEEYAKHIFETASPEFADDVKQDDFVVAGSNFGCGSSREIAPLLIKISGVGAVLAKSFGRIFYRNAINNGMLLIQCDTDQIVEGDVLTVDTEKNQIKKKDAPGFEINFKLGEIEKRILNADGLLNLIEKEDALEGL